jgi:hypothetical protein
VSLVDSGTLAFWNVTDTVTAMGTAVVIVVVVQIALVVAFVSQAESREVGTNFSCRGISAPDVAKLDVAFGCVGWIE